MFRANFNTSILSSRYPLFLFTSLLICIPFSLDITSGNNAINIPAELLIFCLTLLMAWSILKIKLIPFLKHPISLVFISFHIWSLISTFFSQWPGVSIKYNLVSYSHFICFYLGYYYFEIKLKRNLSEWLYFYCIGLIPVIVYTWLHHAKYLFRLDAIPITPRPFYNDHTLYSACLAMILPFSFLQKTNIFKHYKVGYWFGLILIFAITFSFSRATWLSTIAAAFCTCLISYTKILKTLFIPFMMMALIAGIVFIPGKIIHHRIRPNPDSTQGIINDPSARLAINDSKGVSNMERLNRYSCAIRMAKDHPWLGIGPGCFQFAFVPYQLPDQMTRISIRPEVEYDRANKSRGHGGGAHSEVFQSLSELGLPGMVLWLSVFVISFYSLIKMIRRKTVHSYALTLAIFFALMTYFIHGFFNNFLHNEELSVLFYAVLSKVVILDQSKDKIEDLSICNE